MIKIKDFEEVVYNYDTMLEMTTHIKTMGGYGYSVVAVNSVSLRAVYRKDLP